MDSSEETKVFKQGKPAKNFCGTFKVFLQKKQVLLLDGFHKPRLGFALAFTVLVVTALMLSVGLRMRNHYC